MKKIIIPGIAGLPLAFLMACGSNSLPPQTMNLASPAANDTTVSSYPAPTTQYPLNGLWTLTDAECGGTDVTSYIKPSVSSKFQIGFNNAAGQWIMEEQGNSTNSLSSGSYGPIQPTKFLSILTLAYQPASGVSSGSLVATSGSASGAQGVVQITTSSTTCYQNGTTAACPQAAYLNGSRPYNITGSTLILYNQGGSDPVCAYAGEGSAETSQLTFTMEQQ